MDEKLENIVNFYNDVKKIRVFDIEDSSYNININHLEIHRAILKVKVHTLGHNYLDKVGIPEKACFTELVKMYNLKQDVSEELDGFEVKALLNIKVDDLDLSAYTIHPLQKKQIEYIGELVQFSDRELLAIPGFTTRQVEEVKKALVRYSLSTGMNINYETPQGKRKAPRESDDVLKQQLLDSSIEELDISFRTISILRKYVQSEGRKTMCIGELFSKTRKDLSSLEGFGEKSYREIKNIAGQMGFIQGEISYTRPEERIF
jgi:DNA-directed RNA polymerase alpha subunit